MPAVKFSIHLNIEPDSEVRDFEMLLNQRTHSSVPPPNSFQNKHYENRKLPT